MTEEEGTPQMWTENALMLTTFQMPLNVWTCSNINRSNIGIKNLINVKTTLNIALSKIKLYFLKA